MVMGMVIVMMMKFIYLFNLIQNYDNKVLVLVLVLVLELTKEEG